RTSLFKRAHFNFALGRHQKNVSKANDRNVDSSIAWRPGALVDRSGCFLLFRPDKFLGRERTPVGLVADPVETGVQAMIEVRNTAATNSMVEARIQVAGIWGKGISRSDALVSLHSISRIIGRTVKQREAIGVRTESIHQVETGLVETTTTCRAAVVREVQHEVGVCIVDGPRPGRRLDGENRFRIVVI